MTAVIAINAGLGDPSSTRLLIDRVSDSIVAQAGRDETPITVETVDLRELATEIAQSMVAGFALGPVAEVLERIYAADGLIVGTPVFNASYSGLFKSFFDLVDVDRMSGTPVIITATGGSPRHALVLDHALRPLFSYLHAMVVPTGIYAAAQDWAGQADDPSGLAARIARATRELLAAIDAGAIDAAPPVSVHDEAGIANFARLLGDR